MDLPRLGYAVIVNNVASDIPGSSRDVEALELAYETVGFNVQVHNDCDEKVLIFLTVFPRFLIKVVTLKSVQCCGIRIKAKRIILYFTLE